MLTGLYSLFRENEKLDRVSQKIILVECWGTTLQGSWGLFQAIQVRDAARLRYCSFFNIVLKAHFMRLQPLCASLGNMAAFWHKIMLAAFLETPWTLIFNLPQKQYISQKHAMLCCVLDIASLLMLTPQYHANSFFSVHGNFLLHHPRCDIGVWFGER